MSTTAQLKGNSLKRQLERARRYADHNGLELVNDADLRDIGVSAFKGANIAGGALGRFLSALRNAQIERGSYVYRRVTRQDEPSKSSRSLAALS